MSRVATLLAVVLGCGRPPAPVEEPRGPADDDVAVTEPPPDAALDAPPPPAAAPTTGNAPTPSVAKARVLGVAVIGNEVEITLDRGTNDGIDNGWRGRLIDQAGKRIAGSGFVVFSVTAQTSRGRTRATLDQVKANPHAILEPPH